jgi:preprotein translocase subunit SecB
MSDQDQNPAQSQEGRQFGIHRIYLRDLSFEVPGAPDIFRQEWKPKNELNLNTQVKPLGEDAYEVVLTLTLNAKLGDKTAYLVEVQQAGIFGLQGFSEQEKAPLLGAYCPAALFPYAREAISDLIAKGSFPQLLLQPVNFDALFLQHQQEQAKRAEAQSASAGVTDSSD